MRKLYILVGIMMLSWWVSTHRLSRLPLPAAVAVMAQEGGGDGNGGSCCPDDEAACLADPDFEVLQTGSGSSASCSCTPMPSPCNPVQEQECFATSGTWDSESCGCTGASTPAPTPTPTPASTPSPTPTVTPSPTATPSPTVTPTPTPTPSPSPTPTPQGTPTPTVTPTPTPTCNPDQEIDAGQETIDEYECDDGIVYDCQDLYDVYEVLCSDNDVYQTILEYVTTVGCENEETYCDGPGDGQFPDVSRPVKRDKPRKIEADVVERGPVRAIESDVTEEHGIDLHEAALDAGGTAVLRFISGEGATYPNVDELAKRSDLIVVGRTISNRNLMQVDGKFITESVWVAVQEVIKGNLKTGSRIPITVPGGAHEFPDGSFVVLKPADAAPPHDGQTCIFFLQNPRQGHKERTTTGEFQGLYYFSAGTISAADQIKNDPVVEKYSGMRVSAFLAAVHRAAGGPSTSRRAAERIGIRRK